MNLYYEVDDKKLAKYTTNDFLIAQALADVFKGRFKAVCYIFYRIYKISSFSIEAMELSEKDYLLQATFCIKTRFDSFKVVINDNNITISNNLSVYNFKMDGYSDIIVLKDFSIMLNDKIIKESFKHDLMTLEIFFKDNGKTFCFEIPGCMDCTFDWNFCNMIKSDSSIQDMKKIYLKVFYGLQSDYAKLICNTVLSVWQRLGNEEAFNKGILLDELTLANGNIVNCQLGNAVKSSDGWVVISFKNGAYEITGFENDTSLDINGEMLQLLDRRKKLN